MDDSDEKGRMMSRTKEEIERDDEQAEMHELMDMPPWKAQKTVQENFDKADAEFRKWQQQQQPPPPK